MAHRMACEHPEILSGLSQLTVRAFECGECNALNTGVDSVAANGFVNVLQISGSLDRVPSVNGGNFEGVQIPSIKTVAERWAVRMVAILKNL